MKYTIFYSWQSDLPNNTNRGFIEETIKKAIKEIQKSGEYELTPSIDKDTAGIPGAPNISQTILEKIKTSDAFIADISLVTGNKKEGQRLSPNPNVLIELGYAIALLGWERIILVCNEVYGSGEDLPFDIRQHRRLGYSLNKGDSKAEVRNELANKLRVGLYELLEKGKLGSPFKSPILSVRWNYWVNIEDTYEKSGTETKSLYVYRIPAPPNIKEKIEADIEKAKKIDGRLDLRWNSKLEEYIQATEDFLRDIENPIKYNNYLILTAKSRGYPITLLVENEGNIKATAVKARLDLPEWLLAFDKLPDTSEIPTMPLIPKPEIGGGFDISNISFNTYPYIGSSDSSDRTASCYVDGDSICFWADGILHKHFLAFRYHTFALLAKPDAPIGKQTLSGEVFCSEYEDYKDFTLEIEIQDPQG